MIDAEARQRAVRLLEKADEGEITNWQLEDSWPEAKHDPAMNCILRWVWTLYDDSKEVLVSDCLDENSRAIMSRCIKFLQSENEFPLRSLSESEAREVRSQWGVEWRADCTLPDDDFWPFPAP